MYGQQNLKKRIRYYVFPAQYMLCAVMCRGILHQLCVCHWIARICQLANFTSCIQPEGGCISAETRRCLLLTLHTEHNKINHSEVKPRIFVRLVNGRQTIQSRNTGRDKSRPSLGSTQQPVQSVPAVKRALCPRLHQVPRLRMCGVVPSFSVRLKDVGLN